MSACATAPGWVTAPSGFLRLDLPARFKATTADWQTARRAVGYDTQPWASTLLAFEYDDESSGCGVQIFSAEMGSPSAAFNSQAWVELMVAELRAAVSPNTTDTLRQHIYPSLFLGLRQLDVKQQSAGATQLAQLPAWHSTLLVSEHDPVGPLRGMSALRLSVADLPSPGGPQAPRLWLVASCFGSGLTEHAQPALDEAARVLNTLQWLGPR